MFKNILVAVDGSEHGYQAAQTAGELARAIKENYSETKLWIVVVYEPISALLGHPYFQEAMTERLQQSEVILKEAKDNMGTIPGEIKTEVLEGPPAEAILSVAEARQVDLIVMGTRGLGRLAGLLIGSQSQKVVAHAACPVLLVRKGG